MASCVIIERRLITYISRRDPLGLGRRHHLLGDLRNLCLLCGLAVQDPTRREERLEYTAYICLFTLSLQLGDYLGDGLPDLVDTHGLYLRSIFFQYRNLSIFLLLEVRPIGFRELLAGLFRLGGFLPNYRQKLKIRLYGGGSLRGVGDFRY